MLFRVLPSVLGKRSLQELYPALQQQSLRLSLQARCYSSTPSQWRPEPPQPQTKSHTSGGSSTSSGTPSQRDSSSSTSANAKDDWERNPDFSIRKFSELPDELFGVNQHMIINEEFKEALRQILWKFRAPIRYAFAYGSGVFPQQSAKAVGVTNLHPSPPEAIQKVQGGNQKMIDFIFGVSYSQHWHSLNLQEHPKHYSAVGSLGSYVVSKVQDSFGAGVYFNPYITVNGTLIKYGVVNIDTLCRDLSEWDTMYLAGRLQKPVKILRDNPSVRLANQVNLISAVRTALLLLPEEFTEQEFYGTIAGISYMGDPRMSVGGDDPRKVANIVQHQLANFRRLYAPLIENLPNISFNDSATSARDWMDNPDINAKLNQNMDPFTRGHMVRRLPNKFREKLYFEYQRKFRIPRGEFNKMMAKSRDEDPERIRLKQGGPFEQRIASDTEGGGLREEVKQVIEKTIRWPSFSQSVKGVITAGFGRSWKYIGEKRQKGKNAAKADATKAQEEKKQKQKDQDK